MTIDLQERGTCQVCGMRYKLNSETSRVAHHGYKIARYGYRIGGCAGSRKLPWEFTCEDLLWLILKLESRRAMTEVEIEGHEHRKIAIAVHDPLFRKFEPTDRVEPTDRGYEALRERKLRHLRAVELELRRAIIRHVKRWETWKPDDELAIERDAAEAERIL